MAGGLYRSASSAPDGGRVPADGATPIATAEAWQPAVAQQPVVEATAPPPEPAGGTETGGSAAGNSAIMAIGSLVSRGTGFLRTLLLAVALGAGAVGNAYTTAQILPGMVYEFLLGGILTSVLVPVLVRRRKGDPDAGQAYAQRLLSLAVLALAGATAIAMLLAPALTLLYGSEETSGEFRWLVTRLSWLMLPMIFFSGLSALISAVLNTRGHFAAPMWAPILNNLVVIATIGVYALVFGATKVGADQMTIGRIALLGGGTLLGVAVQAAGLLPALRKVGFRWRWRLDFGRLGLGELARLGAWTFCYVAVSQIGLIVVFNLVNRAGEQGKAGALIYNNVFLLLMMAHGIIAVSIITALMPRMSAAAADERYSDMAADLSRGTRTTIALLAPVAVCYAVLSTPVAFALFRHGAFSADDAAATAPVLFVAGLALIPFAISQLFTFGFYAMPDTRMPALINIPVVALRIAVQVGLFMAFSVSFTASGLMVGNGVSYLVAAVVSAWLLRGRVGPIGLGAITMTSVKVMVAALGAALAGIVVIKLLPGEAQPDRLAAILQIVVGGAVIGGTYLGLAMALRVREITQVVGMVRRKLGR